MFSRLQKAMLYNFTSESTNNVYFIYIAVAIEEFF